MPKKTLLFAGVVVLALACLGALLVYGGVTDPAGNATGQLPDKGGNKSLTLRVNPTCSAQMKPGEFCSLDEALGQAAQFPGARIVLLPGEHRLGQTIKTGVALVAKDAPQTPTLAAIKKCLLPPGQLQAPKVTLVVSSSGTQAASFVNLESADETVIINGIRLGFESPGQPNAKNLLKVKSGRLLLANSQLDGRLAVAGDNSTLAVANSRISSAVSGPNPEAGAQLPLDGDRYNEVPVAQGLCGAAGQVGLSVTNGAQFYSVGLDLSGTFRVGVCVEGAEAHLCQGKVHDIDADGYGVHFEEGWGALVHEAGQLDLEGVEVSHNRDIGILADGAGTLLTLRSGAVVKDQEGGGPQLMSAMGVVVQDEAELVLEDSTVEENEGPGLVLSWGATATVQEALFQNNEFASIVIMGASLELRKSTILGGAIASNLGGGFSLWASDGEWGANSLLALETDFDGNGTAYHGAVLWGNGGTTQTLDIRDCTFHNFVEESLGSTLKRMGGGVFAGEVCQGLNLSGNSYHDNEGIHLFLHKSDATVTSETIATNHDLDVKQQQCDCGTPALDEATLQAGQAEPLVVELCDENTYDKSYDKDDFTLYLELADIEG